MDRVSSNLPNDNMQYFTRQRQVDMNAMQSRLASQNRILNLRDDPAAAGHAGRYQSFNTRLERYSDNIQRSIEMYRSTETQVRSALDILHEVRQLAVQAANATYPAEERKIMAGQVDEYLQQLVQVANATDGEGNAVFGGFRTKTTPFRTVDGVVPGHGSSVMVDVEYLGDIGTKQSEIADNQYIDTTFPGNQVFWAENQSIFSARDASSFVLGQDSVISIDDQSIQLKQGDNVYAVIAKINDSNAAVKARLDPIQNSLVLETTNPHQIWMRDQSGTVLQDLGVVKDPESNPPHNLANGATRFGGSLFDMVISLRDNLYANDQLDIGGRVLSGLDKAMGTVLSNLGSIGAKTTRMELAYLTTEKLIPDYTGRISRELDLDVTKAITDYKVMEMTHKAALSTAARIIQPSLLDFLR